MQTFGYYSRPASSETHLNLVTVEEQVETILTSFQYHNGLETTGKMDASTEYLMSLPRCGVKDNIQEAPISSEKNRARRYLGVTGKFARIMCSDSLSGVGQVPLKNFLTTFGMVRYVPSPCILSRN